MFKRFLQNFLIFAFTASFVVILIIGMGRIRSQGNLLSVTPKPTIPTPTKPTTAPATSTSGAKTFVGTTFIIPWGNVTVAIDTNNGVLTNVRMTDVPDSPPSQYAQGILVQQAIQAGNANIQGVSGATYTSLAFKRSLESAIANAGI